MWQVGKLVYQNPPEPEGGEVTLPEVPGLGLEPDEGALTETRTE